MNDTTAVARQQQVADSLRRIADALAGSDPADLSGLYVHLTLQPGAHGAGDAVKIAAVDGVASVVLGRAAETQRMSNGTYHHGADGRLPGNVYVSIYNSVADPAERELHAEVQRLRAALATREAAAGSITDPVMAVTP